MVRGCMVYTERAQTAAASRDTMCSEEAHGTVLAGTTNNPILSFRLLTTPGSILSPQCSAITLGKTLKLNALVMSEFEQKHMGNNSPYKMPLLTWSASHTRKPSRTGLVSCIPYGIRSLASAVTSREIDLGPRCARAIKLYDWPLV